MIRTIVPMFNLASGLVDFEIIIYNRSVSELSLIPNEVIHSIARRFPNYTSTPFALAEIRDKKSVRTSGRRI